MKLNSIIIEKLDKIAKDQNVSRIEMLNQILYGISEGDYDVLEFQTDSEVLDNDLLLQYRANEQAKAQGYDRIEDLVSHIITIARVGDDKWE